MILRTKRNWTKTDHRTHTGTPWPVAQAGHSFATTMVYYIGLYRNGMLLWHRAELNCRPTESAAWGDCPLALPPPVSATACYSKIFKIEVNSFWNKTLFISSTIRCALERTEDNYGNPTVRYRQ